jgi:hypothetical protein
MLLLISEGCTHNFLIFLYFRKSHLIGPSPIILEHGALPNIECFPFQNRSMLCHAESLWFRIYRLYTWKLNYGQKLGDKKCGVIGNVLGNSIGNCGTFFWEHLEEQFGNLGNPLGVSWEHYGNRLGTNEKNKKIPPPKEKN